MILDRFFGMVASAAFALGIVVQGHLLANPHPFDPFDPLLLAFAALALIPIGYATLRAERKHGLIDPYDDSVNVIEIAYSLPTWARVTSFALAGYIAFLYLAIYNVTGTDILTNLPANLSVLQQSLPANGFPALFASLFMFSSFVIAIYLLVRKPIKEFR